MLTPKRVAILVFSLVAVLGLTVSATSLFETNMAGYMQVKQAAVTGELTCRITSGAYWQGFGTITTYPQATTLYFGVDDSASDETVHTPALRTTFSDNAMSSVLGSVRVTLPTDCDSLLKIHNKFKSIHGVMNKLVLPALRDVAFKTGPHMTSGESIAERRAEFSDLFRDQLLHGVIKTKRVPTTVKNMITGELEEGFVQQKIPCDDVENPSCITGFTRSPSAVEEYDVSLAQFEIADIEYKKEVLQQIEAQRKARMDILTQEAEAQKADARSRRAEAEARAKVAETRATEEVQKTERIVRAEADKAEATLQAEKVRDVAKLEKEAAEFTKKKEILLGEGEATRKRLVMQADGALEKKLQALIEINAKYADALSKAQPGALVPSLQMGAGSGTGSADGLIDLLKAKTARDLSLDLTVNKK